jgi:hypothetical protein
MQQRRIWMILPLLCMLTGCGRQSLPNTPLFAHVSSANYADGSHLIQQRLDGLFPHGSSPAALARYLKEQGLALDEGATTERRSGSASFRNWGPICGSQVRIVWETDEANTIKSISTTFSDTGCP